MVTNSHQLDLVFGALADPTRRAILARLESGPEVYFMDYDHFNPLGAEFAGRLIAKWWLTNHSPNIETP